MKRKCVAVQLWQIFRHNLKVGFLIFCLKFVFLEQRKKVERGIDIDYSMADLMQNLNQFDPNLVIFRLFGIF